MPSKFMSGLRASTNLAALKTKITEVVFSKGSTTRRDLREKR